MSITPDDLLNEARNHADRAEEIGLRTAVSRGYYSGYHRVLTVSHLCPEPPSLPPSRSEGSHASLIRRFESVPKNYQGAALARQVAALLARGRALRVAADYKLDQTVGSNDARRSIHYAEQLEKLAAQLAEKHPLAGG